MQLSKTELDELADVAAGWLNSHFRSSFIKSDLTSLTSLLINTRIAERLRLRRMTEVERIREEIRALSRRLEALKDG